MLKIFSAFVGLLISAQAGAVPYLFSNILLDHQTAIQSQAKIRALAWKVGDQNDYVLDLGLARGSLVMKVRKVAADGIWMDQNVDLGPFGKQNATMLIDPNTGETKRLIVDGKEQEVPTQNLEVISVEQANVTVLAGTFESLHYRLLDKNTNQEANVWINPEVIPMSGLIQSIQPGTPSQTGMIAIKLKSFHRAK